MSNRANVAGDMSSSRRRRLQARLAAAGEAAVARPPEPQPGVTDAAEQRAPATTRVRVRIAGEEYTLKGPCSPARLQALAAEVDRRLAQARRAHPTLSLHQAAVLTALQLADEWDRERHARGAGGEST